MIESEKKEKKCPRCGALNDHDATKCTSCGYTKGWIAKKKRKETERMRLESEREKRDLSEKMASKRRASARGGKRMLLADTRLSPETGIEEDETLGTYS